MKNRLGMIILVWVFVFGGVAFAGPQGKPVLFAGDTPDVVYRRFIQAKWGSDVDTVLACLSERVTISREDLYKQLMLKRSSLPQELRLLQASTSERVASLQYFGIRDDHDTGKTFYWRGNVTLVKEEGTWRIRHETWESVPPPHAVDTP